MNYINSNSVHRSAWNKGVLVGSKPPLKLKEIWAIRIRLELENRHRDLALFNLAIDSKLRGCDLVSLRVRDIVTGGQVLPRAMILQRKTQQAVQFEITEHTRETVAQWIRHAGLASSEFLFPSRVPSHPYLSTRQYGRLVKILGNRDWAGPIRVWHALNEANQSHTDLPEDQEH